MKESIEGIYSGWSETFSGACLVKSSEDIIFSAAAGEANMAFGIANTVNTKFDTASVTKVFTAAAVLLLVEEGLLSLNDRITEVIDLEGTMIPDDVTIEQLLNHTSGIADDAEEANGEDYSALFVTKPNYSIRECSDFLPQFAYKKPNFVAGTSARYNNCAFILLGLAIEKLSGLSYRDFVTTRVFEKCGMVNSRFGAMDEVNTDTAEGYVSVVDEVTGAVKWKKNIYSYPPIGTADGGAYSTVADLDLFVRTVKNGELLSPAYAKLLFEPHCEFSMPHFCGTWTMGYAFEFILADDGEVFCMFKEGYNSGVEAVVSYFPQFDVTVCLLANKHDALYGLFGEIQGYFYGLR